MNSKPVLMSSSIVVAPIEAADGIAREGVQNRPHCDCNETSAMELLVELGTLPERVVTIEGAQPVLVWKLSTSQVSYLSHRDPDTPLIRPDDWAGVDLISLPRKNPDRYEELYRQITRLAAEAVGRDELLLARVQYVGPADIH